MSSASHELLHTNYTMAAGRIGVSALLLLLLGGIGTLFLLDEHGSRATAAVLYGLMIPFLWIPLRVPLWVRVGEFVEVRYLFGVREFGRDEVESVGIGVQKTQFSASKLAPLVGTGYRKIPVILIRTKDGRKIVVRGTLAEAEALRLKINSPA